MPTITKSKLQKIFEFKNQGYNIAQIAKKLHASRNTVKAYLDGKPYKNPNVAYPVQQQPQVAQIVEVRAVRGPTAIAVESYESNPQSYQQRDKLFRMPRELQEEKVHIPYSELRVGGRLVSEMRREPPAPAIYRGPPVPPDYPRFIPVPGRREPENNDMRDEDKRFEREKSVLPQQLLQKNRQEKKMLM